MADETEESYASDNLPCTIEEVVPTANGAKGIIITGAADPRSLIQRGFRVKENDRDGFEVTSFVRNTSDQMLWSGGVWAIAAINPNCCISIPTGNPGSKWQDTTYHVVWEWAGHQTTARFVNTQLRILPGMLNVMPGNEEGKVMVQAPAGAIVAQLYESTFIKSAWWPLASPRDYPANCNLAVYSSPGMRFRESETMGPKCERLDAGNEILHSEQWYALDDQPMSWWNDPADLHQLVAKLVNPR